MKKGKTVTRPSGTNLSAVGIASGKSGSGSVSVKTASGFGARGTGGASAGLSTGSGSRPGKSKYPIGTSAPADGGSRGLTRQPKGWLK